MRPQPTHHLVALVCCAAMLLSACVTSERGGAKNLRRIHEVQNPIDAYTYRIEKRGAVSSRPRSFMVQVSRAQGCEVTAQLERTYDVRTIVKWPKSTTWVWLMAGAGGLIGYFAGPPIFEDSSKPEEDQDFLATNPWITASVGASAFLLLSLFLPDGDSESVSEVKETEPAPREKRKACGSFEPVTRTNLTFTLDADGEAQTLTTDGNGRAEVDISARSWKQSIDASQFASVRMPDGSTHGIEMTDALKAHAEKIVQRAKQQQKPPRLSVFAGLEDPQGNGDGVLDATERAELVVRVENTGGGTAYAVKTKQGLVALSNELIQIVDGTKLFGDIPPGQSVVRRIELVGQETLPTGRAEVTIAVEEEMGFGTRAPARVRFETRKLRGPELKLAAYEIFDGESAWAQGDGKNTIGPGEQIELRVRIANTGPGSSRNVMVRGRSKTKGVSFVREQVDIGRLAPGQAKTAKLVFRVTNEARGSKMTASLELVEQRAQFSRTAELTLPLEQVVASTKVIDVTQPNRSDGSACPDASKWVLAVMDMRGGQDEKKVLDAMTRQLHIRATQRRLKVVSRSAQDQELKRLVNEAKAETFKECYDERCQVELGKALAASHLLVSSLETFGGQCTLAWEVLELQGETTVCGSSGRGKCDEPALLGTLDEVAGRLPAGH